MLLAGVLAGCGAAAAGSPPNLTLRSTEQGKIVTDPAGRTLYLYLADPTSPPRSTCSGDCANDWPPDLTTVLPPRAAAGITALVGTITRPDGTHQVTLGGYPLYYFAGDHRPGDTYGAGVGGRWYPLDPGANPIILTFSDQFASPLPTIATTLGVFATSAGLVVTNDASQTVYVYRDDTPTSSACTADWCVEDWPPVLADGPVTLSSGIGGRVGTITRPDGTRQVTLNGHPLYTFAGDYHHSDIHGQGIGRDWYALAPNGAPITIDRLPAGQAPPTTSPLGPPPPPPLPPTGQLAPGPTAAAYIAFNLEGAVTDRAPTGGCWDQDATEGPAFGSYRHDLYYPGGARCGGGGWAVDVQLFNTPQQAATAADNATPGAVYHYYEDVVQVAPTAPHQIADIIATTPGLQTVRPGP